MAKGITLKDKNGGTLYPKTVADLVLDSETGEPIGKVISSMGKITTDDKNGWLRVEGEGKSYFVELTELVTPNAPTIGITIYDVVKDSFDIIVKNNTTGATMEYKIGENDTWKQIPNNNKITCNTGYTNDNENGKIYLKIYLRATKNGEESDENIVDITVNPKVAIEEISVKCNDNDNEYSTEATITIKKSPTNGAVTKYQVDEGEWTILDGESKTFKRSVTTRKGYYKVKAERNGYVESDILSSSGFTLGTKKFYYGYGPEELKREEDIKSLKGGGVKEQKTMAGSYKISYEKDNYLWFCGTGTLTSVAASGFGVPMNQKVEVAGYNCYRSGGRMSNTDEDTFVVS